MTKKARLIALGGLFLILVVLEAAGLVVIPPLATLGGLLLILVVFVPRRAARGWTIALLAWMSLQNLSFLFEVVSNDPTVLLITEENQLEFAYIGDRINAVSVHNPPLHMRGARGQAPWFLAASNLLFAAALFVFAKRAPSPE